MPNATASTLAELPKLGKAALCRFWKQVFDGPLPRDSGGTS